MVLSLHQLNNEEMDEDPAVEPELDAFSLILPLPYRVAIILVTGVMASLLVRVQLR